MADDARMRLGQQAFAFFRSRGLPDHQAAALAGNMAWESGGHPDTINPGDNYRGAPTAPHSFGIAQWNGDRLARLVEYARSRGADIPAGDLRDQGYMRSVASKIPVGTQLEYAWQEMQGPEARAYRATQGGTDLRSATAGAISYHRPAGWSWGNPTAGHGFDNRFRLADAILRQGGGENTPPAPEIASVAPASMAPASLPPQEATPATPQISGLSDDLRERLQRVIREREMPEAERALQQMASDEETPNILPGMTGRKIDLPRLRMAMASRIGRA